jgi:elongator complex protein 2
MASLVSEYISVGGNRHPGAADWDVQTGVLAFGADNNVALWEPLVSLLRLNVPVIIHVGMLTALQG